MTMYYIARPGGDKQGPFPESTVRANLRHAGHYAADTLVWCKGMSDWQPLRSVFKPEPAASPAPLATAALTAPPAKYYIAERGGQPQGPYPLAELLQLPYPFTPRTLIWHKGMPHWTPLAQEKSLTPLLQRHARRDWSQRSFHEHIFPNIAERGTRTEYLASAFSVLIINIAVIPALMNFAQALAIEPLAQIIYWLTVILFLLSVVHMFMQSARRLHDVGISGASLFFFVIPLVGWIPYAVTMFVPGNKGRNDYGLNPRGTR